MGDLMQASDGNLYGMTSDGGNAIDNGVLFRYEISSGTYTVLHTFSSATGTNPSAVWSRPRTVCSTA